MEDLATRARAYTELHALLVRAADALSGQPAEERSLRIRAAQLAEEELGSQEQAAVQLRRVREVFPDDADALAGLTRLALAGERWEEARDLLADRERLEPPPPERAALATQRGDLLLERLHDPVAAVAAYRRALEFVPREQSARLLARTARALEAAGDRDGLAEVLEDLSHHPNLPPGLDLPTLPPPTDPLKRMELARERLSRDPHDVAAAAEMEQLAEELDSPADLAWALEQRLSAALFDSDLAFRIAELRRTRLGDPAGALRLLAEVAATDPDHPGSPPLAPPDGARAGARRTGRAPPGRPVLRVPAGRGVPDHGPGGPARRRAGPGRAGAPPGRDPDDPRGGSGRPLARARRGARSLRRRGKGAARRPSPTSRGSPRSPGGSTCWPTCTRPPPRPPPARRPWTTCGSRRAPGTAPATWPRSSTPGAGWPRRRRATSRRWRPSTGSSPGSGGPRSSSRSSPGSPRRGGSDPARRLEVLLRRAVLLEGVEDPQAAVDAFAAVLEEFPQEGAALSGLARALARPGSRAAAARLLEKVHRASGDQDQLADLLELRLEDMAAEERPAALAELAGLRERAGKLSAAFEALARQYALERGDTAAEPRLRAELCRLADAAGTEERLAEVLSGSLAEGLPDEAAIPVQTALAAIHRSRQAWGPLAAALQGRARLERDFRVRRELLAGGRRGVAATSLSDADGAREAWREVAELLDQEGDEAAARPGGAEEAADARLRAGRIRMTRLGDGGGAVRLAARRARVGAGPRRGARRSRGALAGAGAPRRQRPVLRRRALRRRSPPAENAGKDAEADGLRIRLAALREEHLHDAAGALALLEEVLARQPGHGEALSRVESAMAHDPERAGAILEKAYTTTGKHGPLAALLTDRLPRLGEAGGGVALRLGALLEGPLGRPSEAPHFYEEARRLDPALAPRALLALERLYRKLERFGELATTLEALADAEPRPEERTGILFVLAQLCEERLSSPGEGSRRLPPDPRRPARPPGVAARAVPDRRGDRRRAIPASRSGSGIGSPAGTSPTGAPSTPCAGSRREQGDLVGLAATLRKLIPFEPGAERELRLALAETLIASGDAAAVAEEGRRAMALGAPSDADLDRLGAIFRAAGDADEGARVLEAQGPPSRAGAGGRRGVARRGRRLGVARPDAWSPPRRSARPSPATRGAVPPSTRFARSTPRPATGAPGPGSPSSTSRASPRRRSGRGCSRNWPRCSRPAPTTPPGPGTPGGGPSRRTPRRSGRSRRWSGSRPRTGGRPRSSRSSSGRPRRRAASARAPCCSGWRCLRGVDGGDAAGGAEAVRRALLADPACLAGVAEDDALPAEARARLLGWGAAALDGQGEAGRALGLLEAAHRIAPGDGDVAASLERCYREGGNAGRLADVLRIRASVEADPAVRSRTLLELGELLDG